MISKEDAIHKLGNKEAVKELEKLIDDRISVWRGGFIHIKLDNQYGRPTLQAVVELYAEGGWDVSINRDYHGYHGYFLIIC